ncbi:MAG: aminotransferase class V-fold PLP-dependent enzyme [Acidimicrobiales bacterium]
MEVINKELDVARIKEDFPLLSREIHKEPIVYLDSAASSQRPLCVIEAMSAYYKHSHANVHRGVYRLAEEADRLYEQARLATGKFIGAPEPSREIVFTKNATEAINLVSYAWGMHNLHEGDAVVVTEIEHHANLVPWITLAKERAVELRVIPMGDDHRLDLTGLDRILDGSKLVTCTLMSNVLGTIPPFRTIADAAHEKGALVLADGAQLVPHGQVDVKALGCDFLAFSGHKMLGPTGIGVLWGKAELLDAMPPFMGGGGMIRDVRFDGIIPAEIPARFEAGTPPIAEAVGLNAAIEYLDSIGMDNILNHDISLTGYALRSLEQQFGKDVVVMGPSTTDDRGGVLSLALKDIHPHDLAQVLDESGVCIRAGHHCAKPLMRRMGTSATARASFYLYNDTTDVDKLIVALTKADSLFG